MTVERVATRFSYDSQYIDVLGSKIHFIEQGSGDPILFLHSVPASSYVWRNVIPHLSTLGRCIAPDLIGLGKSDKPDIKYTIEDYIRYIEHFIQALHLKNITLILHGWGSIIGFYYAMHHEKNCKGLVFYESYLKPFDKEDVSLPYEEHIHTLEEKNIDLKEHPTYFVDYLLSQELARPLSEEERACYHAPFLEKSSNQLLKEYIHQLPEYGKKKPIDQLITEYSAWLTRSSLPKLMLYSLPGFITTISTVMWAKEHIAKLEIDDVGEAWHYAQENNPTLMGETISIWLQGVEQEK